MMSKRGGLGIACVVTCLIFLALRFPFISYFAHGTLISFLLNWYRKKFNSAHFSLSSSPLSPPYLGRPSKTRPFIVKKHNVVHNFRPWIRVSRWLIKYDRCDGVDAMRTTHYHHNGTICLETCKSGSSFVHRVHSARKCHLDLVRISAWVQCCIDIVWHAGFLCPISPQFDTSGARVNLNFSQQVTAVFEANDT